MIDFASFEIKSGTVGKADTPLNLTPGTWLFVSFATTLISTERGMHLKNNGAVIKATYGGSASGVAVHWQCFSINQKINVVEGDNWTIQLDDSNSPTERSGWWAIKVSN